MSSCIYIPMPQPVHTPQPLLQVPFIYVVYKWGGQPIYFYRDGLRYQRTNDWSGSSLLFVIDPITAVNLNLVTPEELDMPAGLLAAFKLLK